MKYTGMPLGMWLLFQRSFQEQLTSTCGIDRKAAAGITAKAKGKYQEISASLPDFEKGDRFKMNIVSCAMLSAFLLCMPERPGVERTTVYYREAMLTRPMKWFSRMSGKRKFTDKDIRGMKTTEKLRAADRNPLPFSTRLSSLVSANSISFLVRSSTMG